MQHHAAPLLLRTFASPVELRTPRVLLRQWKDSDADAWAAMNANPEVRRYFPSVLDRAQAQGEADRIRASITQRGWGMWALEVPGVHAFAGFVGLNLPGFEAPWMPAVEIGWRLAPNTWGQGYATEGAAAALHFAFTQLELPQVVAMSVPGNSPSHRVMERIGMVRDAEADFDHLRVPDGSPLKRHILHRITAQQWRQQVQNR
ncbi:MAG: GNAT family N-acetyltransferase [Pseudomonadota bacterium]